MTDPLVTDGAQGIRDFELHRLHYTNSMIDLWTFREDYRYIFRNGGKSEHRVVPLLWRWRMVQANMYVLDAENKNLVYLPSGIAREAGVSHSEILLREGFAKTEADPSSVAIRIAEFRSLVEQALRFESSQEERARAANSVEELARDNPKVAEFGDLATFLSLCKEYYLPLAILETPVKPGDFSFVRHGVDLYTPLYPRPTHLEPPLGRATLGSLELLWFFLRGRLEYRVSIPFVPLNISRSKSFHCRIVVPPGLRVVPGLGIRPRDIRTTAALLLRFTGLLYSNKEFVHLIDRSLAENKRLDKDLLNFLSHDDSNVYFYLGQDEMARLNKWVTDLAADRRSLMDKLTNSVDASTPGLVKPVEPTGTGRVIRYLAGLFVRVVPQAKVTLGLGRGMIWPVWLLWILAGAVVILSATRHLDITLFTSMLSLILILVLTIGVFALDKRILREYISAHAIAATAVSFLAYFRFLIF